MSDVLQSLLAKSAMEKLRELDARGTRFIKLLRKDRGEDALMEFLGILERFPDWTQLHFEVIDYPVKRESAGDRLSRPLRRAIEAKPDDARLRYVMGLLLQAMNDQKGAAREYEEAIRLRSDYAVAYHNLGVAYSRPDPEKAIELWQTATRLNPRLAESHFALGTALMKSGRKREGVESFRRFVPLAYPHLKAFRQQALLTIQFAEDSGLA